MGLETGTYVSDLVSSNPTGNDDRSQGDDHLRLIKAVLQATLPNASKAFYFPKSVTKTANYTILATDMGERLVADATSGAFNLTLPTLGSSDDGWSIWVVKSDSTTNAITLVGTVNGASNPTIAKQYQAQFVIWSGSAWYSVGAIADPSIFISKDAGASAGPTIDLYRDSASPATSDFLGTLDFNGRDSAANKQLYARVLAQITDATTTTEDAVLLLQAVVAGTLTTLLQTTTNGISLPGLVTPLAIPGSTTANRSGSPTEGDVRYNTSFHALEFWNGTVWVLLGKTPTTQRLLTPGSGTYTPNSGMVYIEVELWGPGAGGGARTGSNGNAASADSSFENWTAKKGSPGSTGNAASGGAGGTTGTDGTGTLILRVPGEDGGGTSNTQNSILGGIGGSSFLGGAGAAGLNVAGGNAKLNSGSGGGGAGGSSTNGGSGGGAGEWVKFRMTAAQIGAGVSYTIGAKGTGGAAGGLAGGDGADGGAIVTEHYD